MNQSSAEGAWSLQPVAGGVLPLPWLWLGGWSLGGEGFGPHDEREAQRCVEYALYQGIRHIDAAGFYAHGRSEALLAKVLQKRRAEVFISSKGGLVWEGSQVRHDGSRDGLRSALESSLARLNTDYLDLFQLHWPDPGVPLGDSIAALRGFQEEGLIRYWGVGNLAAHDVEAAVEPEAAIPHQVHFNPLHPARDVLNTGFSTRRCINCIISPLEQGLLAEGSASGGLAHLGKSDVRRRNPLFRDEKVLDWVNRFQSLCADAALTRASVVLLWIFSHEEVDAVVLGARSVKQVAQSLEHRSILRALELGAPQGDRSGWGAALERWMGSALWEHLNRGPHD